VADRLHVPGRELATIRQGLAGFAGGRWGCCGLWRRRSHGVAAEAGVLGPAAATILAAHTLELAVVRLVGTAPAQGSRRSAALVRRATVARVRRCTHEVEPSAAAIIELHARSASTLSAVGATPRGVAGRWTAGITVDRTGRQLRDVDWGRCRLGCLWLGDDHCGRPLRCGLARGSGARRGILGVARAAARTTSEAAEQSDHERVTCHQFLGYHLSDSFVGVPSTSPCWWA
jgi:hypothetical protein